MSDTKEEIKSLQIVETLTPAVFEQKKIEKLASDIRKEVMSLVPDASSEKGRAEIKSLAYKVARSKTTLDNLGKSHVAEIKAKAKVTDDCRKYWRDAMDLLKTDVMEPVTQFEHGEQKRVEAILAKIEHFRTLAQPQDQSGHFYTAVELQERFDALYAMELGEEFEEFEEKAQVQWAYACKTLKTLLAGVQAQADAARKEEEVKAQAAKDQAEQDAKDRIEREARLQQEAVERTQREEREKFAAKTAERENAAQREREEYKRAAAAKEEEYQAKENERVRIAQREAQAEQERIDVAEFNRMLAEEQEQKRVNDVKHRQTVNRAALKAFVEATDLTQNQAQAVVEAIIRKQIPNVSLTY